jgi:RNA polymerase sigma-70 factor (ECF subfamily)
MVFNLYIFEQYTHKEIGEMLGISDNTSKSQLSKARRLLSQKIAQITGSTKIEITE